MRMGLLLVELEGLDEGLVHAARSQVIQGEDDEEDERDCPSQDSNNGYSSTTDDCHNEHDGVHAHTGGVVADLFDQVRLAGEVAIGHFLHGVASCESTRHALSQSSARFCQETRLACFAVYVN